MHHLSVRLIPIILVILSCCFTSINGSSVAFAADQQPVERPTLRVLSFYDPFSLSAHEAVSHFEAEFDCWVSWDFRYEYEISQMSEADFAEYDVITVDEPRVPQLSNTLIACKEWKGPVVSEIEEGPFAEIYRNASMWQGQQYGKPILLNLYLYVYRSDWFNSNLDRSQIEQALSRPLEPPKTIDELLELNRLIRIYERGAGMAPITRRSEGMVVDLLVFFRAAGVKLETLDDLEDLDVPKMTQALLNYREFFNERPNSSADWFIDEINTAYVRGEVPQIFQWWSLTHSLKDPMYSQVGASSSFRELPGALGGGGSVTGVWLLAIPKATQQDLRLCHGFIEWWCQRAQVSLEREARELSDALIEGAWSRPKFILYGEFSDLLWNAADAVTATRAEAFHVAEELASSLEAFAAAELRARGQRLH